MSQVAIAVSVAAGVWVAYRQLHSWKGEKLTLKRADLGEALISHASELISKFQSVRSPMGFVAPAGEDEDGAYDFRRRLNELADLNDEYAELRRLGVRQKALVGNDEVQEAIDVILDARVKLIVALKAKIRDAKRDSTHFGRALSAEDIQRIERYEELIWDGYDQTSGSLTEKLSTALNIIEAKLLPYVRHSASD